MARGSRQRLERTIPSALRGLWQDLLALDERVQQLDQEIEQSAQHDPVAVRLQQLRAIGPVTTTAL